MEISGRAIDLSKVEVWNKYGILSEEGDMTEEIPPPPEGSGTERRRRPRMVRPTARMLKQ